MNALCEEEEVGVRLARRYWDVGVNLNVRRYRKYCRRMDRQLAKLEARWARPTPTTIPLFRRNFDDDGTFCFAIRRKKTKSFGCQKKSRGIRCIGRILRRINVHVYGAAYA